MKRGEPASTGRTTGSGRPADLRFGDTRPLVPLLAYTVIAVIATHPLWLHMASAVPSDIGDPLLNTWILAWDVHALTVHPLNLFEANIFFPLPSTLAYSEHLLGSALVALPVLLVTGEPVVAYNFVFLLSFILGGWGAYLLVRRYTDCGWAAFLAGLAFAYAPYRLTAFSHLQLLTYQWLPFSLLCLEGMAGTGHRRSAGQVHRREKHAASGDASSVDAPSLPSVTCQSTDKEGPSRRPAAVCLASTAAFAVLSWLQIVSSWHLAVFSIFTIGIYATGWWLRLDREKRSPGLARFLVALVAVGVLTWPLVPPYLEAIDQLAAARSIEVATGFGASPADYAAAPPWNRVFGPLTASLAERPLFTEENFMFVGVVSPLLAALGLWHVVRRRRDDRRNLYVALTWLVIGAGAWVLSWGPYLDGVRQSIPLPYYFASQVSSILGLIRVPSRWMIAVTLPVAVLVGYGAWAILGPKKLRPTTRIALFVLVGGALLVESWSVPLPLATVGSMRDQPSVYRWLAAQPGDFGIIEWPIYVAPRPEYPETRRLYGSTVHWKPLVNGYSGFTPDRQVALDEELAGFPDERSLVALRDLGRQGVRYLIVHTLEQGFDRLRWDEADRWVLEGSTTTVPVYEAQGDTAYLINPWGDAWIGAPEVIPDESWRSSAPRAANLRWQGGLVCLAYGEGETVEGARYVDLYWRPEAPFPAEMTVFVHLLDATGNIVAQGDGLILAGHFPAEHWSPGDIVQDRHVLVPVEGEDILSGTQLRVGLYDPLTEERLPVLSEDGQVLADHALLPWGDAGYQETTAPVP